MSRSGYSEDYFDHGFYCYRGAVASALRGRRGQAFLRELVTALDALPEKKLDANSLVSGKGCCALGAVALKHGLKIDDLDEGYAHEEVAERFGIAEAMAAEIMYENDEGKPWRLRDDETPEQRWERMRKWAVRHIELREDELE